MNFMKWIPLYVVISAAVLIPGVYSMVRWGFLPSISFTGGSLIEIAPQNAIQSIELVQSAVEPHMSVESVQLSQRGIVIRGQELDEAGFDIVSEALKTAVGEYDLVRFESVGPAVSEELIRKTIAAVVIVAAIILVYIGWQFTELKYGVAAVMAMLHDTLVLLGAFSLLGHFSGIEVDVLFVTAVLTTLSFSVHDTIVVFHRIRELRHKYPRSPQGDVLNTALTETMSRSITNSVTIIVMLLALVLLGGSTIFSFAFALLIGAVSGTYSSAFVAVPLLLAWDKVERLIRQNRPRIRLKI